MMLDWNEYQKELGGRLGELAKLSPDTLRGYQTLSAANSKTGKLDEKTRQLISLAVAVTTRCDGCIVFHSEAALKAGASKEELDANVSQANDVTAILERSRFDAEDARALAFARHAARKSKNFALADTIRDRLKDNGVVFEDTPKGVRIKLP